MLGLLHHVSAAKANSSPFYQLKGSKRIFGRVFAEAFRANRQRVRRRCGRVYRAAATAKQPWTDRLGSVFLGLHVGSM